MGWWKHSTTSSSPPSVTPNFLFVSPSPTSTTLRELVKSSAALLSREPFAPVMSLELCPVAGGTRRFSPLSNTRSSLRKHLQEIRLVCLSRVLPRMRRFSQMISSMFKRMESLSPLHHSLPWLLYKSTLVSSSLDMRLLSSVGQQRLHARCPRSCGRWARRLVVKRLTTPLSFLSTRMLRLSLSRVSPFSLNPLRRVQHLDVLLSWIPTD